MNDGEIDIMVSFNPAEAAVSVNAGLLPPTVRTVVFSRGTIGNTSFVAIPYNAANKEGAMVVANFLLDPATQARAQDYRQMGNFTVLDLAKLSPAERKAFDDLPKSPALPTNAELGSVAARAAPVLDDAHRGRMGEAVHQVTAAARSRAMPSTVARLSRCRSSRVWPARCCPRSGTCPAIGGDALSLAPWRALSATPGFATSLAITLFTGIVTAVVAVAIAFGFCAWAHGRPWMRRASAAVGPILATPHCGAGDRARVCRRALGLARARALAVAHRLRRAARRRDGGRPVRPRA